jgi:hypothetical protein
LEPCKESEDDLIANGKLINCYNINILNILWENIHVIFIELCPSQRELTLAKSIILE